MAVRFILGRAGAGKTQHGLRAMSAALTGGSPDAAPCILLVPEQASLETERALLALLARPGTTAGAVYSFRRFAQVILAGHSGAGARLLSPAGRTMALQRLLGELRPNLRTLGGGRLLPGLHRLL